MTQESGAPRWRRWIGVGTLVVAALGVTVALRDHWMAHYWAWQADRALTQVQRSDLDACSDPGPVGVARLLAQDAAVACDPGELAAWTTGHRERAGYARWLDGRVETLPTDLLLFRDALVRSRDGRDVPFDLAARLDDADVPLADRTWSLERVADGGLEGPWVDPVLADRAVLVRFIGGRQGDLDALIDVLSRATVAPGLVAPVEGALSEALDGVVGVRCEGPCWSVAVAALRDAVERDVEGWDGGGVPEEQRVDAPAVPLAEPLWRALYGDGADEVFAARWLGSRVADWVASAPDPEAALLLAVASPHVSYGVVEASSGEVGDPAAVWGRRRGSPWATALAARALGDRVGVEVSVAQLPSGTRLSIGSASVDVFACGLVPEAAGVAEPVGDDVIVARAALEAAGAALLDGDEARARRLLGLAERSGIDGAVAVLATPGPGADLGAVLGGVASAPSEAVAAYLDGWRTATGLACPVVYGAG